MRYRKYSVNDNFFNIWSKDMAYALGFISADGNISKYTLSIDLQRRDVEVLQFLSKTICPTASIKEHREGKAIRLRINSKKLVESLVAYNVVPAKSLIIRANFPIPEQYKPHYIRGVFDGDGWVITRRNSIECGIASGSKHFLLDIQKMCGGIGQIKQNRKKNTSSIWYCLKMQGKTSAIQLRDFMYGSGGFALTRKKDKFFSEWYIQSPKYWTPTQLNYLKTNFTPATKGCLQDIGDAIGKSRKAVSKKVWELSLTSLVSPSSTHICQLTP